MGKGSKKAHNRKTGARTPTGRLSEAKAAIDARAENERREAFEDGPMQTVLRARRRQRREFRQPDDLKKWWDQESRSVTKEQVKNQALDKRGSVLGRLLADGHMTEQQVAAGEDYCERYTRYAALNGLPRPTPQGPAYGAVRGGSRPERPDAAMKAKAAHMADQRILSKCSAGVSWAIKRACVTDEAAPLHLIREGLDALVKNTP